MPFPVFNQSSFVTGSINTVCIIREILSVGEGLHMTRASPVCHIRFSRSASQTLRPSLPHKGLTSIFTIFNNRLSIHYLYKYKQLDMQDTGRRILWGEREIILIDPIPFPSDHPVFTELLIQGSPADVQHLGSLCTVVSGLFERLEQEPSLFFLLRETGYLFLL